MVLSPSCVFYERPQFHLFVYCRQMAIFTKRLAYSGFGIGSCVYGYLLGAMGLCRGQAIRIC